MSMQGARNSMQLKHILTSPGRKPNLKNSSSLLYRLALDLSAVSKKDFHFKILTQFERSLSIYAQRITALERLRTILESPLYMPFECVNENRFAFCHVLIDL